MSRGDVAVVVDALPYIDHEYDEPGVREAVLSMVEEETRRYRPTKNYLEHLPALRIHEFETELMKGEFERLQNRLPMEMISMKRYELPAPPHGRSNDLQAWAAAVENSHAQLEQQVARIVNLELLEKYGAEAWRQHNEVLINLARELQGRLQDVRRAIQDIHYDRKTRQTEVGEKLRQLESDWVGLVSKNYEIERACCELEKELAELEKAEEASSGEDEQDSKETEEPPAKKPREDATQSEKTETEAESMNEESS